MQTREPASLPEFVACRDVRRMLGGCSNATINNLVDDGVLPRPFRPRRTLVLFEKGALLQAIHRMQAAA
jgi:hypothetical protein